MNPYNLYPNHPAIGIKIKIYTLFYLLCMGNHLFLNPDIQGINLFVIFNLHYAFLFILINGCYYCPLVCLLYNMSMQLLSYLSPFVESTVFLCFQIWIEIGMSTWLIRARSLDLLSKMRPCLRIIGIYCNIGYRAWAIHISTWWTRMAVKRRHF